jgi:glutamyl endopeptidase
MFRHLITTVAFSAAVVCPQAVGFTAEPAEPLQDARNAPVSSDGSVIVVDELSKAKVSRSSRGRPGASAAGDDFLAEFRAITETPEELYELLSLRPASAALGRETIIGTDDRVRVDPTTTYPARATVLITFDDGRCSGWMIGPDTVATAGHCVHTGGPNGSWRTGVVVYPGRNGDSSPYGSCTARTLHTVAGWIEGSDDRYDYGAVKLNCSIGNTTGWYGFFWTTGSLLNLPTIINGYPGDKPLEQWTSTDVVRETDDDRVFYQNDTFAGMSGGPVYYDRSGCGWCSMAIHAYGTYNGPPFSDNNHGTRIRQAVFDNLLAWKNAP